MSYTDPVTDTQLRLLDALLERGARHVTFHPDGALASVIFHHESAPAGEDQHETPAAPSVVKRRAVSRLVPRVALPDNQ